MVREIARDLAGKAAVVQVNTDQNPILSNRFQISGVPALILFRKGTVLDRMSGAAPRRTVTEWVGQHLPRH